MRQEEGEIVSNNLTLFIDPDLFTKNANATGTPKTSFVIGILAKRRPFTHGNILAQVMYMMHHLSDLPGAKTKPSQTLLAGTDLRLGFDLAPWNVWHFQRILGLDIIPLSV